MARDDAQDAKLRDAKRRAAWTIPLEHYYRPEASVTPFKLRRSGMIPPEHYWPRDVLASAMPKRYGYLVAKPAPSQRATGPVQASPAAPPRYNVEPVAGGCVVIHPRFGGEPRVKLRRKGEA